MKLKVKVEKHVNMCLFSRHVVNKKQSEDFFRLFNTEIYIYISTIYTLHYHQVNFHSGQKNNNNKSD